LLKLNLQVVLEKVRAQEAELRALKDQAEAKTLPPVYSKKGALNFDADHLAAIAEYYMALSDKHASATIAIDNALKKLREAKDLDGRVKAADGVDQAVQQLHLELELKAPPKKP